ncbi:MAG: hydroxyacid dehydrogenase [Chloroflexi bacterium]|nr:hydroxyacid dehydrogenase [Chloroflexota bacterium]
MARCQFYLELKLVRISVEKPTALISYFDRFRFMLYNNNETFSEVLMNNTPMAPARPKILVACNRHVREGYLPPAEIARLETLADWEWFPCEGGSIYTTNEDPEAAAQLRARVGDVDGMIVCHGSPTISAGIMEAAPQLKIIGELEGDRFASRIDLEAAWERHIRTVDTTNGSSYPVAEWALGLMLVALRNAGAQFRRMIAGQTPVDREAMQKGGGLLSGKRVGLIGCGHMGRRLMKLLQPFAAEIWVYDPYLPREMPEALGFLQTSLDNLLSHCQVIVCLAPLTPRTRGMIGARELDLIAAGATLVNVSRGPIIDSAALVARLKRGDITAGLDVFDPEPVPPDSEILQLPNVFLSPHMGWYSGETYPPFFSLMVDELERYFHGHATYFDLTPNSLANRRGSEV